MRVSSSSAEHPTLLWLAHIETGAQRALVLQAFEKQGSEWVVTGDVWQCGLNANALQRLQNKWQQAGQPTIHVVREPSNPSAISGTAPNARAHAQRWQIWAPGHAMHRLQWEQTRLEEQDWRLLQRAGLQPRAVAAVQTGSASETTATSVVPPTTAETDPRLAASTYLRLVRRFADTPELSVGLRRLLTWLPPVSVCLVSASLPVLQAMPIPLMPQVARPTTVYQPVSQADTARTLQLIRACESAKPPHPSAGRQTPIPDLPGGLPLSPPPVERATPLRARPTHTPQEDTHATQ